jgi:glycosyltransferase involved in cell wall biosynthesis
VGRNSPYKGYSLGVEAFLRLKNPNYKLVIAGEASENFLEFSNHATIELVRGWLSESELERIIGESEVLLLPYLDGTQSGLIDIANSLDTYVVATPVGALPEQIMQSGYGAITSSLKASDIANSLNAYFRKNNMKCEASNRKLNSISEILEAITSRECE